MSNSGYDIKSATGPFSFAGATKFEARDNGTVVTFAGQVEGSGILKLAERLAARQLEKQERRNYDTLKRILGAE